VVVGAQTAPNRAPATRLPRSSRRTLRSSAVSRAVCAFAPHRSRDDPHAIVLYEKYRSRADLEAHRLSTHYAEVARGRTCSLLAEPTVALYEALAD
jgi:quinol monooxygenase YgiN